MSAEVKEVDMRNHTFRWIPKDAQAVEHPEGLGTVYTYSKTGPGTWNTCAVAYRGKTNKPVWNYSFHTQEQRDKEIADWFAGLTSSMAEKKKYQRARETPHGLEPGAIVVNSWGYDQTNKDFYQVTKATPHFVVLKPLEYAELTETGFMQGYCLPAPGKFPENAEETKHHAYRSEQGGVYVTFRHGSGSEWKGGKEWCSWYA